MDSQPHELEPIAGISLASFVDVSRELARYQFDATRAVDIAAQRGIERDAWAIAVTGWIERLRTCPDVAEEFERIYHGLPAE
jgi:hypothetical protein